MFVILTALNVEHQAVLEHLTDVTERTHVAGTVFEEGTTTSRPHRRIALGVTGPGTTTAAALTERARSMFSPTAMLFVGVAGGLRDWLEIGDVVVATKTYSHHGARSEDDGDLARPRAWDVSHALEQRARRLPRGDAWYSYLPDRGEHVRPGVHFDPIAAGDVLLNSRTSPLARSLHSNYNDAIAVEMESSGFAHAGHLSGNVPTMTIRAISDHADGTKSASDRAGTQLLAARNAAAFAIALVSALDDVGGAEAERDVPTGFPPLPTIHNTNTAHDNARVGQQVGVQLGHFRPKWTGNER
ncbi:5'-methylthioadenosine/S-adenosylhomocysteine nucleosidase family protein [Saccharothrix obliqua]|uniref:5'-methylthioadenosine/S-adenosylhomocysteine nucleosidase family protein n=1 Tax=Saccharothrix obliqua TaxID=2861747 RepID=UPI001C5FD086|nr:5'-methylthioadenosine/S-adenosylhomocysteine nucleosidase [Saccharothrix obliqua]MBW4719988.1 5'-methylthioadenosine/S-adenosylhomocysteine nucleosidase [Saccharothrix obliqua]